MSKRVMATGFFDGLHSGHIRFLELASSYGDLLVIIGQDEQLKKCKGVDPIYPEHERLYMVRSLRCVSEAKLASVVDAPNGITWVDHLKEVNAVIINDDLSIETIAAMRRVCDVHGVEFLVMTREPQAGLVTRSSSQMRKNNVPFRVTLTTGADQMSISRGLCVGFSIEPTFEFEDRSGMATSSRRTIQNLWGSLPTSRDPIEVSKLVFATDNPPTQRVEPCKDYPWGTFASRYITGSVDPILLCVPGVNALRYSGGPWPEILTIKDEDTLTWLESVVGMVQTQPRPPGEHYVLDLKEVQTFIDSTYRVWEAVSSRSTERLASACEASCIAFSKVCPTYLEHCDVKFPGYGRFVQGAGHGGYIAVIGKDPPGIRVKCRRGK